MRPMIPAVVVCLAVGLIGCTTLTEQPAPPFSTEQLTQMRDEYRRTDPDARVGLVTAVLAADNLASVSDVPVKDFSVGDIITFVDTNGKTLTMGTVEAISHNTLTVKYSNPGPKGAVPVEGDAAVRAIH